ncbi:hypothetical protein [Clavibacter sp. VKM Ac-2872]|uniref:hypothetical protein n=1 Tax=Clavibacter sp. VKM Ac-2872 TaxID=2783812 RepID=UPI00188C3B45|nr:hypothetical protein [Clavibacter sp. VKM Ac-2872]MBF4625554.1 hypothetical protein [Clavibacter sp. VKM Ac-2872]
MSALRRIYAKTIWHPDAIPAAERKYASPLKRVFLPLFDALAVTAGWVAIQHGIPSIDRLLPAGISDLAGYLFLAAGFAALVGIAFPAAWAVEIAGKVLMFALLGVYLLALRHPSLNGEGTRDFIGCVVAMAMVLALYRLWILGRDIGDRRRPPLQWEDQT